MSWYSEMYDWILDQKWQHPEMSDDELRKHCSANYPLRERKGYAYKMFLAAMKDYFGKKNNTIHKEKEG